MKQGRYFTSAAILLISTSACQYKYCRSTSIAADVDDLPCFIAFLSVIPLKWEKFYFPLTLVPDIRSVNGPLV